MALALPPPAAPPLDLASLLPPEPPLALGYGSTTQEDDDYTPGPKLDKQEILDTVSDLKADHSLRIAQSKQYSHFLGTDQPGHFTEDEEDIENDIIETMPLLGAREEYEFRVGWLAGHGLYPRLLNRDMIDRDEAIPVEDLVTYDFQCEERQYARRHRSDLWIAEGHHLCRFGALVGIDTLDPDAPSGIESDLLDPLTVFPVWGGQHGLLECYRVWEDTNRDIIGTFGGQPGTREYRRIEEKVKKTATKTKRGKRSMMDRQERRTVTQVWSYDEMVVILDEEVELLRVSHGYRRVPITIRVGAFDQPVGISIGAEMDEGYDGDPQQYRTTWGDVTVSATSADIARQWRPYAWRQMWAHQIAEAVAGRQLSFFKHAWDPHIIRTYDPSGDWNLGEAPSLRPGETSDVPLPGNLAIITPVVDTTTAAGLAANLQSNASGGGYLTQARMGNIPPQTSGSAMGRLQQAGGSGDVGLLRAWVGFNRDRAEWRLELRKVFGDSIGSPLGVVRTPARKGYSSPVHDVTPELLERSGTEIDLEAYQPTFDVAAAQWAMTLRTPSPTTGKPVISDDTVRRRLKVVQDIERESDRIDDEALQALPPVAQQRHLARLGRDLDEAKEAEDHESAADIMIEIAELEFLHDQAIQQGTAAPGPGGPPGAGGMGMPTPAAVAAPPTPGIPGTSLPEQGIDVGHEGGAPFGGGAPQATTQPTPLGGPGVL